LLKDFYLPRWKMYLDRLAESLKENQRLDRRKYFRDLKEFELQWIRDNQTNYSSKPVGDTIEAAHRLFKKYIPYYRNKI